ncbi:MAG TPA: serine protease [Vicinamibacterales bacterium]|nr:serine protease [Vicinamibacterales bacterium]
MTPDSTTLDAALAALPAALDRYDWPRVDELCGVLVARILAAEEQRPAAIWKSVLARLRKKRRFGGMGKLAEALVYVGQDSGLIQRQYAQSLIDRGLLVAAERVLQAALQQYGGSAEEAEIKGLLGRVYKQWYVTAPRGVRSRDRATLQHAIDAYMGVYEAAPDRNYWHGINVVALLAKGGRDGIDVSVAGDTAAGIARQIVTTIDRIAEPHAFDVATVVEAHVALQQYDDALARATEYVVHPESDAFEIGSTLRQLEEVWQLSDREPPGAQLLPVLRAALLRAAGGSLNLESETVTREPERIDGVKARIESLDRQRKLERVYGVDRFQTLDWYNQGLTACKSIARVETTDGQGLGTSWIIRAGDWFANPSDDRHLLITNAHVICRDDVENPYPGSSRSADVQVRFQVLGVKSTLGSVVWSSEPGDLDCTIATVTSVPADAAPLPLAPSAVRMTEPPPRMLVIGHPRGGDLVFSLQDNYLVACTDRLLQYRTPTEPGSSGSPVFDMRWRVVGLHHAGDTETSLAANEGIALGAIRAATRQLTL